MKKITLFCATALLLSGIGTIGTTLVAAEGVSEDRTEIFMQNAKPLNFMTEVGINHTQATFDPDTNEFVYQTTIQETSPGGFAFVEGELTGVMVGPAGTDERHVMNPDISYGPWGTVKITFKGKIERGIVNNYDYFVIKVNAKSAWGGSDTSGFAIFTLPR